MKVLGLLIVIAIVIIGYCVYNPMVVDSADFTNTQKGKSSSSNCKGPFGFDSQSEKANYNIGVVSDIDLEKSDAGTWYVDNCKLSNMLDIKLNFKSPYPQQNALKVGDIIGFSGSVNKSQGSFYFTGGKILDNISSQAANCKIDAINRLSTPTRSGERLGRVTGVIMAVQIRSNDDPEPDDPDDFQITQVAMKCADANLYIVYFQDESNFAEYPSFVDKDKNVVRNLVLLGANLPSHEAFGEGDVVTLEQVSSVSDGLADLVDLVGLADLDNLADFFDLDDVGKERLERISKRPLSFDACYK